MGYTTDFYGQFELDAPLTKEQANYLTQFCQTRRMKRDVTAMTEMPDPIREAVGLPLGPEGAYFVGGGGMMGQEHDASVVEYNHPPQSQPGPWCQWVPTDDLTGIEWDGGEKFYEYVEWLTYLIENFLKPWGRVLSGEVEWEGEDRDDRGKIVVKDNVVTSKEARVVYDDEDED